MTLRARENTLTSWVGLRIPSSSIARTLEDPIAHTQSALSKLLTTDSEFRHQLNCWMLSQGWELSSQPEQRKQNLGRASRLSCYILLTRLVFYQVLRRRFRLMSPLTTDGVDTPEHLREVPDARFKEAVHCSYDYETVFVPDADDLGYTIPFLSPTAPGCWPRLIQRIEEFDFSSLDSAEMTQFFRIIRDQSENMRYLIGDLLDVARIETGTLPVSPEPVEAGVLVDEARSRFQSGGGRSNLVIDLPPELPRVMADRRSIVQSLGNLLSNAAHHSNELSPIRVAAVRDGVHVAFSVADDGVGVPAERLPHLFRKFSRLDGEERGREIAGSGLGLAICKGIVEAHGGRIRAESDGLGLGSRFTFTVPAVEEAVALPPPLSRRRRTKTGERPRVLCVDDDPQTLRYVRDALAQAGYTPVVTGDAEEVSRLMAEEAPRLVLLDMMLPGRDGMELMKDIREVSDAPVIFLSVNGQEEVVTRAFDMGAADYVVKPFSPTELAARIRAALRKRAAPELAQPSKPYVRGELTVDYAQRRVTVAGNSVELTDIEYRMLVELSVNAGRALTHEHLLQRVWGPDKGEDSRPVRNIVKRLRRKLGEAAANPAFIFAVPRVGYRMEKGEEQEGT